MFWVKAGGTESSTLPWPPFGRLHLSVRNSSLHGCPGVVLVWGFRGFRVWGHLVRAPFSSVPLSQLHVRLMDRELRTRYS